MSEADNDDGIIQMQESLIKMHHILVCQMANVLQAI